MDNKIIDNHYRRSAQRKEKEDLRKWRNKLSWDWQFKDKFPLPDVINLLGTKLY